MTPFTVVLQREPFVFGIYGDSLGFVPSGEPSIATVTVVLAMAIYAFVANPRTPGVAGC